MDSVKLIAIEPFDGNQPGQTLTVTERQADQLIAKGLAKKAAPEHANKMKPAPENKANPLQAVGRGRTSSASPAARPSQSRTARQSGSGAEPEPGAE